MINLKSQKSHIHFVGIGGIGMSALAFVLKQRGYSVSGSDSKKSKTIEKLSAVGVSIFTDQEKRNIKFLQQEKQDNLIIVYSSAIPESNEELKAAKEEQLDLVHRSDILNALIALQPSILIAGSHGKTTTSTIVTTLLALTNQDPTTIVGGIVPIYQSNGYSGKGKYLVAEADESDGTLIKFKSDIGLVTNLELDHTDFYKDMDDLQDKIKTFGLNSKTIIANYDCKNLRNILKGETIWYSTKCIKGINYCAIPVEFDGAKTIADYYENGEFIGKIKIPLVGNHNLSNVLGAISICRSVGINFNLLEKILHKINTPSRRFEFKGFWEGRQIVDDYAHHPSEIKATISMAKIIIKSQKTHLPKRPERLIVIFQPHRYSRTKDLLKEFSLSFKNSDAICLLPIYSAGEETIDGINSEVLESLLRNEYQDTYIRLAKDYNDLKDFLSLITNKNDLVLFLGAGNINQFSEKLISESKENIRNIININ